MKKRLDLSLLGQIDMTQDQVLDWLQQGYTEPLEGLAQFAGTGPYIISGMAASTGGGGLTSVAPGWFCYDKKIYYFAGGSFGPILVGQAVYVVINTAVTQLPYYSGASQDAQFESSAGFTIDVSGIAASPTQFPYSSLQLLGTALGNKVREAAFNTIIVNINPAGGGITGTLKYRKNYLTNCLHIQGLLTSNNPGNLPAPESATYVNMGAVLPATYRPAADAPFMTNIGVGTFKDYDNSDFLRTGNGMVTTAGNIQVLWVRPSALIAVTYTQQINAIIPLD